MTDTIRVTATGRAPGYMPEFVARELGFFAARDIEVETIVPHDWEDVLSGIASGEWDLALGGIWVPSMYLGNGRDHIVTGQLCHRAGFSVVSREPLEGDWKQSVAGKSVLVPGRGGASLTMFFEMYLAEQGVEPKDSRIAHDLTGEMMTELYAGGAGDVLMIEAVQARRFAAKGHHINCSFLEDGEDIPWSVYYTTPETYAAKGDAIQRFNAALDEAMEYMNSHAAAEYVPHVMKWYPNHAEDEMIVHTEAMRAAGMWTGTKFIESSYMRWQQGIVQGGLLNQPVAREDLVAPFAIAD